MLIVLGAAALPFPDMTTSGPAMRWLGDKAVLLGNASYSVSLFHVPFIYYLCFSSRHIHTFLPHGDAGVWTL